MRRPRGQNGEPTVCMASSGREKRGIGCPLKRGTVTDVWAAGPHVSGPTSEGSAREDWREKTTSSATASPRLDPSSPGFRPSHALDLTRLLPLTVNHRLGLIAEPATVLVLLGGTLRYMLPRKRGSDADEASGHANRDSARRSFFYFDSVECLPDEPFGPSDLKPESSRYDAQISIFGARLQHKLEQAKLFMVGSGALGCEFLKNFALMGISCSLNGKLTVTDNDVIEKSNLSRQFLFRDWNIGQPKSTVASTAAMAISP